MKLAFCLFKYFPYGGLQRDCLRIAKACQSLGHDIHIFTTSWQGEKDASFTIHIVKVSGLQNHVKNRKFVATLVNLDINKHYDLVIGFNKMPNLDVYYAADVCYQARIHQQRKSLHRYLPRFKQQVEFENAVFAHGKKTEILLIAKKQQAEFETYYHTEPSRFHLLPPGISRDRIAPDNANEIRANVRATENVNDDDLILLMLGSGFKTKGLDRSIHALHALPETLRERCKLWVIGQDDPSTFIKLAKKLKVQNQIKFFGGRDDVANFLLAADLLLHPAYHENTGTALLESLVAGLPVLTVDVCGYAHYITEANAGMVLPSPFNQELFNQTLSKMLLSPDRASWKHNAISYAKYADIYDLHKRAAAIIETIGLKKHVMD